MVEGDAERGVMFDTRCDVCGGPSVEFDSWFQWYPCMLHRHLTPTQYKDAAEQAKQEAEHAKTQG